MPLSVSGNGTQCSTRYNGCENVTKEANKHAIGVVRLEETAMQENQRQYQGQGAHDCDANGDSIGNNNSTNQTYESHAHITAASMRISSIHQETANIKLTGS